MKIIKICLLKYSGIYWITKDIKTQQVVSLQIQSVIFPLYALTSNLAFIWAALIFMGTWFRINWYKKVQSNVMFYLLLVVPVKQLQEFIIQKMVQSIFILKISCIWIYVRELRGVGLSYSFLDIVVFLLLDSNLDLLLL